MPEPLPDPRLRRALEQIDLLKRELRTERVRSGNLRHALAKAQRLAADAKPKQEQRRRAAKGETMTDSRTRKDELIATISALIPSQTEDKLCELVAVMALASLTREQRSAVLAPPAPPTTKHSHSTRRRRPAPVLPFMKPA